MSERLRYSQTHWSREEDAEKALKQYLELGENTFNKTMITVFDNLVGDVRDKRILDYGGGAGIMAIRSAKKGADVVIVDAEENALKTALYYAKKQNVQDRVNIIHSETFPQELKNQKFDIIFAKDIIEHIEDDQEFLNDLSKCQKRGGRILISTQNSFSLNYLIEGSYQKYKRNNPTWCGWDDTHLRFYTVPVLKKKLNNEGYRYEKCSSMYIIPYGILSYMSLFKFNIELPALRYFDLYFGGLFPFKLLGWNFVIRAVKL